MKFRMDSKPSHLLIKGAFIATVLTGSLLLVSFFKPVSLSPGASSTMTLTLSSPAFEHEAKIPAAYTCDENRLLNPEIRWSGVPEGTQSLALISDDPDVPKVKRPDGVVDHWVIFNISPEVTGIPETDDYTQHPGTAGTNTSGALGYMGPCPPPEYEPSEHRYFFKLFALDTKLDLPEGATKKEVLAALEGHVLAQAELMGRYKRR